MRMWQRIFLYSLLLITFSQVLGFIIYKFTESNYLTSTFMTETAANLADTLNDETRETVVNFLEFFNRPHRSLWLENPDGTIYAGEALPGLASNLRQKRLTSVERWHIVNIMESTRPGVPAMAETTVTLRDGPAVICFTLLDSPVTHLHMPLIQGMVTVLIFGAALSLIAARRITRPLRRLRRDVLDIAAGNLEKRANASTESAREINDVAQAINQLAASQAKNLNSMRELLANISHELRSPLARMSISAVLMEDMLFPEQAQICAQSHPDRECSANCPQKALILRGKVQSMQKEIEHISRLIGDSLLNSKLDLQDQEIILAPVSFSDLCLEMCRRHENSMLDCGLELKYEITPNLWVEGDETLLCQVLSNLLDNSVKYTVENGQVQLRLHARNDKVLLEVQNTHENLPEEVLKHLFDPFYRGGQPTGNGQGAGLGLSLVNKIIKAHKGSVSVTNAENSLLFTVILRNYVSE